MSEPEDPYMAYDRGSYKNDEYMGDILDLMFKWEDHE